MAQISDYCRSHLTGVIGADVVSLSGGSASFANKNVGNGKSVAVTGLVLSGTDEGNYKLSSASHCYYSKY